MVVLQRYRFGACGVVRSYEFRSSACKACWEVLSMVISRARATVALIMLVSAPVSSVIVNGRCLQNALKVLTILGADRVRNKPGWVCQP